MQKFTLGRKIDFTYPTNRLLVILFFVVFFFSLALNLELGRSLLISGGFFLCWAICREVDPANDFSAFFAGGIFLLGFWFFDGLELAVLFWLLLLIRLMSRICGKNPSYLDLLVVTGLTIFLLFSRSSSIYIFLFSVVLCFSYFRYVKNPFLGKYALFSLGLFLATLWLWPPSWGFIFSLNKGPAYLILFALLIFGGGLFWVVNDREKIKDDFGVPLEARWVRLAQFFFVASTWFLLFFEKLSTSTYLVFFSVMSGSLIFSLAFKIIPKNKVK